MNHRKRGKGDKHDGDKAEAENGASISMQALPKQPAAASATKAAVAAPAAPVSKPDPVAAALKGNEKLFSGKVGQTWLTNQQANAWMHPPSDPAREPAATVNLTWLCPTGGAWHAQQVLKNSFQHVWTTSCRTRAVRIAMHHPKAVQFAVHSSGIMGSQITIPSSCTSICHSSD